MNSSTKAYQKFDFGTTFGGDGRVVAQAARPKRSFTPEEVEDIRAAAYREGQNDAEARAQMAQAQAVQALADAAQAGLSHVQEAIFAHKQASIALCLKVAEKIAAEALNAFPQAPLMAAMEALEQEITNSPRLVLFSNNPDEALKTAANEAALLAGFNGQISFRNQPSYPAGAFEIAWHEGRAEFNPAHIFETIEAEVAAAITSEQLHHTHTDGAAHDTY